MIHWCAEETNALLASLPVLGAVWMWLRTRWVSLWKRLRGKNDCGCPHDHK